MSRKLFSGESLEKALQEGTLTHSQLVLIGMVKPSEKSGYVGFAMSGCDEWIDLPTNMIEQADHIGQIPCRDHSYSVMKISLTEQSESEGKILLALLAQITRHPSFQLGGSCLSSGIQSQGTELPMPSFPTLMSSGDVRMKMGGRHGGFGGFNGFGPTLPSCGYKKCVCGCTPPGEPPIECYYYCCTWPSGLTNCPC